MKEKIQRIHTRVVTVGGVTVVVVVEGVVVDDIAGSQIVNLQIGMFEKTTSNQSLNNKNIFCE